MAWSDHDMATVTWAELDAALAQAKLGVAAADLHGSVTGYLCAGWGGRSHELLAALALESEAADVIDDLHALLNRLIAAITSRLRAGQTVAPLLPPGPLPVRADAMVDWCRGFLGGLGLTGVAADPGRAPEVRSLLDNFGHIAAMHLACGDDDEAALADVLDFIRTGVVRLHAALTPAGRP